LAASLRNGDGPPQAVVYLFIAVLGSLQDELAVDNFLTFNGCGRSFIFSTFIFLFNNQQTPQLAQFAFY
jgi:hypothetical protein